MKSLNLFAAHTNLRASHLLCLLRFLGVELTLAGCIREDRPVLVLIDAQLIVLELRHTLS